MFVGCAFMEEGYCKHSISFVLENELVSLSMLVFVLHEISWEYGSDWCIGLWKDEESVIYEGWQFCNKWWLVFEKDRKRAKYFEVCLFLWKLMKGVM
jgi:hypothetical protein